MGRIELYLQWKKGIVQGPRPQFTITSWIQAVEHGFSITIGRQTFGFGVARNQYSVLALLPHGEHEGDWESMPVALSVTLTGTAFVSNMVGVLVNLFRCS